MAIKGYCRRQRCCDCNNECNLSQKIPCNPDCENLTEDGNIYIKGCLKDKCDEVKYIFDMVGKSENEIINMYGEIAKYPYEI